MAETGNRSIQTEDPQPLSTGHGRIEPEAVATRHDLMRYLSQSLISEYFAIHDDEVRQNSTYPKCYLIEKSSSETSRYMDAWAKYFPRVEPTHDRTLMRAYDSKNNAFFIDVLDDRFCTIHTIAKSDDTDKILGKLTDSGDDGFDRAWLPTKFLLNSHIGYLRGFKFMHQPLAQGVELPSSRLLPAAERAETLPSAFEAPLFGSEDALQTARVMAEPANKRRLSASSAPRSILAIKDSVTARPDYEALLQTGIFAYRRSLESIQYRAFLHEGGEIGHSVYSNGKMTANGTSISLHMHGVDKIRTSYARAIRRIEEEYSIGWVSTGKGTYLKGEPLLISFSSDLLIQDLQAFVRSVFRASRPFRLFGYPHSVTDDRVDVEALDLHTGDTFSAEITKNWMRVYLPVGACGNVVARLVTNLQHAMDSETRVSGSDGVLLLEGEDAA